MSPSKTTIKPITPSSVKGLMILEALVLAFLGAWLYNEYMNNVYMQLYYNSVIAAHITTYTMAIGIAIGLGGTITTFTLWRNLRDTRYKLERIPTPRLKASVKQMLAALPTIDEETSLPRYSTIPQTESPPSSTTTTNTSIQNSTIPPDAQQPPAPAVQTSPPLPERQDTQP